MQQHPLKPLAIMASAATIIIERMVHILVLRKSGSVRDSLGTVPGRSIPSASCPAGQLKSEVRDTSVCTAAGRTILEIVERAIPVRIVISFIVDTNRRIQPKRMTGQRGGRHSG